MNIAYWTLGEGPVLIHEQMPAASHVVHEWQHPSLRSWYERLAESVTLVRFDHRGRGLSDRDLSDLSLAAHLRDLDAVVQAIGSPTVTLLGLQWMGATAVQYAANHPTDVRALILLDVTGIGHEEFTEAAAMMSQSFARMGHEYWLDNMVNQYDPRRCHADAFRALMQAAVTDDAPPLMLRAFLTHDVQDAVSAVRAPTLIFGSWQARSERQQTARTLLAGIDNARYIAYESDGWPLLTDSHDELHKAVVGFLGLDDSDRRPVVSGGGLRTLLFTDLESSTALTQAVGDAKAHEVLHGHNDAVRAALAAHDGEEVKHTGDGIFAAFGSAVSAVEAALQIQRDLAGAEVRVRIGLNAGEPIAEDDDYFGTAVQLAARVCDRAEPGQVLVSNVVQELCAGKTFAFADQGEVTLKGFPEPVRLFVVREGS